MFIGYACIYSFAIAPTIAFTSLASVSLRANSSLSGLPILTPLWRNFMPLPTLLRADACISLAPVACSIAPALPLLTPHPGILMFTPITPEELVAELYSRYGYSVPLDYAINYIDVNEYATVDDFHLWLQTFENDRQ